MSDELNFREKLYKWISEHVSNKFLYWMVIRAWAMTTRKYKDKSAIKVEVETVCDFLLGE